MKIKFEYIRLALYIVVFIVMFFVGKGDINIGCYWRENYGVICPACGLTRATRYLLRFKFEKAIHYNAFYICVMLPFVTFLVVNDIYVIAKKLIFKKYGYSYVDILLGYGEKK